MKFLILEIFDRNNLNIYNSYLLHNRIYNYCYNHLENYSLDYTNILFSLNSLITIRNKFVK